MTLSLQQVLAGYLIPRLVAGQPVAPALLDHALDPARFPLSPDDAFHMILNPPTPTSPPSADFRPFRPMPSQSAVALAGGGASTPTLSAAGDRSSPSLPGQIDNVPYSASREKDDEKTELKRLHGLWTEWGGRLLVDEEATLPEILQHLEVGEPLIVAGARAVFDSPRWGQVDLNRLNKARAAYPANLGQAELFRDLAIVLDRPRLGIANSKKHWGEKEKRDQIYRGNRWSDIPLSWQHFIWLNRNVDWSSYSGEAGYNKFAADHFQGNSHRAWGAASSLLTDDEFALLNWGRQKATNVGEAS